MFPRYFSGEITNWPRLPCYSLHFAPFLGHFTPILPSHRLCERQGRSAIWDPRKESGHVRSRDDGRAPTASCQIDPG